MEAVDNRDDEPTKRDFCECRFTVDFTDSISSSSSSSVAGRGTAARTTASHNYFFNNDQHHNSYVCTDYSGCTATPSISDKAEEEEEESLSLHDWLSSLDPREALKLSRFISIGEIIYRVNRHLAKPEVQNIVNFHNLNSEEAFACVLYTMNTPGIFRRGNKALREGDAILLSEFEPFFRLLNSGLCKLPKHNGVVFRILSTRNVTREYYVDEEVCWPQFSSCALELTKRMLGTFGKKEEGIGAVLCIQVKDAPYLGPLNVFYPNEKEVVLQPGWRGIVRGSLNDSVKETLTSLSLLTVDIGPFTVVEVQAISLPKTTTGLIADSLMNQLQERVAACPTDTEAHFLLSVLFYNHVKDIEKAKYHLMLHLGLTPESAKGHRALAAMLQENEKDYDGAKKHFEYSLRVDPESWETPNNLGFLLMMKFREFHEAKRLFELALSKNPNYAPTLSNLGYLLHFYLNDCEGAREYYLRALVAEPSSSAVQNNLAFLLHEHFGDHEAAKSHYESSLSIDPNMAMTHSNLALLLQSDHFKDYTGARKILERCIAIDPENGVALNNLANLLSDHFAEFSEARRLLEQSLALDSNDSVAHSNLAALLSAHFNDPVGAKRHYERALAINPQSDNAAIIRRNLSKLNQGPGASLLGVCTTWTFCLLRLGLALYGGKLSLDWWGVPMRYQWALLWMLAVFLWPQFRPHH